MTVEGKGSRWTGFVWGLVASAGFGAVALTLRCADIWRSTRLGYNKFDWSHLHGVADIMQGLSSGFLLLPYMAYPPHRTRYLLLLLGFLILWGLATAGAYLIWKKFMPNTARPSSVGGFALGYLIGSHGMGMVAMVVGFILAVLKFGFV